MLKQVQFFIFLSLLLSCESPKKEQLHNKNLPSVNMLKLDKEENNNLKQNILKKIRFDFSAKRVNSFEGSIEINATLHNDYTDTVYFLSSTCLGIGYSLRFVNDNFFHTSSIQCNASFPMLLQIAPKGKYEFQAHLGEIGKEKRIKMGFDFCKVDKVIDLDKVSLSEIHYRPENEQVIIWAKEQVITE